MFNPSDKPPQRESSRRARRIIQNKLRKCKPEESKEDSKDGNYSPPSGSDSSDSDYSSSGYDCSSGSENGSPTNKNK
jgi:hypothetical protein